MSVCGLIAEFNPFHKGHNVFIEKAKEITKADYLVCVMSGDFVQRGENAILDKYERARFAISQGIDLIIELPTIYATSNAGVFSLGALSTLNSLGIIDCICFGSKVNDINILDELSNILNCESLEFKNELIKNINSGNTYPKARALSIEKLYKDININLLNDPNTLLGIEYINAIKKLNSSIKAYTYIRGNDYSATEIRKDIQNNNLDYPSSQNYIYLNDFSNMLKYRLNQGDFKNTYSLSESLYNKIQNNINRFNKISDLTNFLKTKDITRSHILRALIHILIDIKQSDFENLRKNNYETGYIRVLAASQKGRLLLNQISKSSNSDLITSISGYNKKNRCLEIDLFAANIYNSVTSTKYNHLPNEYQRHLFK